MTKRQDIYDKREIIETWVEENLSKAEMSRRLKCDPKTIANILMQMGIEYDGNRGSKGMSSPKRYIPASNYFSNENKISSYKLKNKLFKEEIKEEICEHCGLSDWLGLPIPLELHHMDGNSLNNALENLQILCPNCHAFTDSYRAKNIKK